MTAGGLAVAPDFGQQRDELVAAEPSNRVFAPQTMGDALRRLHQQFVTHRMSERIVDGLESVEIDEKNRAETTVPVGLGEFLTQGRQ